VVIQTTKRSKKLIATGCFFGLISVLAGAFGTHALENSLTSGEMETFRMGTQYQMYHSFALILVSYINSKSNKAIFEIASWLFIIGIVIFCGSLYTIALSGLSTIGIIAPVGGSMLIAGWCTFGIGILRNNLA
tara:strand:+ start:3440 stop:3838 length:399 start_codon:yes stop_codon:yes gene_type:complete